MVNYHPHDELLMSFAAGQLSNALGLMVACHLEHCPHCRSKVRQYEAIGGALLDSAPTSDMIAEPDVGSSDPLLAKLLSSIDNESPEIRVDRAVAEHKAAEKQRIGTIEIPRPLRRFISQGYTDIEWKGMSKHIKEFDLPVEDGEFKAKFYKISAGKMLPEHTHEGNEYTLVLKGSFSDRTCDYSAGDFILADDSTIHQPRASMDGDCICFAVMDAPLKMTGFFGRMLNPFLR